MNIQIVHEHSVDLDLLPKKATILDLGCRGMEFTNHFLRLGHKVFPLDIDDFQPKDYEQCAITDYTGFCGITRSNDMQATKIGPINHFTAEQVPCYTLEEFMRTRGINFFDLIKMDVEGAEEEIVFSLKKAPSKQMSIEFHMHCGQSVAVVEAIKFHLEILGYETILHEMTEQHGAGKNYWSSLFILK